MGRLDNKVAIITGAGGGQGAAGAFVTGAELAIDGGLLAN